MRLQETSRTMVETPGICTDTASCDVARSGRTVAVPLGTPFVCPGCGSGLVPPVQATEPGAAHKMPAAVPMALMGAGLLVLGGAVFLGRELGAAAQAPAPLVSNESPKALSRPAPLVKLAAAAPDLAPPGVRPLLPVQATPPAALASAASVARPAETRPATPALQAGAPAPAAAPVRTVTGAVLPAAVAPAALPRVALAPAATTLPAGPSPAPAVSAPVAASLAAAAVAPLPPAIADQGFSPVPVLGGSPAYPSELAADGRRGRVNVTCQISAEGFPSACRAAAGRGGPAFAASALAWLAHAHVRYRPVILHGHPVEGVHSWTVAIEEAPSVLAEAKRQQQDAAKAEAAKTALAAEATKTALGAGSRLPAASLSRAAIPMPAASPLPAVSLSVQPVIARQVMAAPPHAANDRPFSSHVVAGGAPLFPAAYDDSRPGAVTVQCTIEEDGAPSLCRVLKAVGGGAFENAVQSWLASGRVRFRPVISAGHAVPSEESWTIVFNSVPAP